MSASVIDKRTRQLELAPFKAARDMRGKKLLLTLDRLGLGVQEGVEIVNVIDWLLGCSERSGS